MLSKCTFSLTETQTLIESKLPEATLEMFGNCNIKIFNHTKSLHLGEILKALRFKCSSNSSQFLIKPIFPSEGGDTVKRWPVKSSREEQHWHFPPLAKSTNSGVLRRCMCDLSVSSQQLPKSLFPNPSRHVAPSLKGHAKNMPNDHKCSFPRSLMNVVTNLMFPSTLLRCPRQPNNPWENKVSSESINTGLTMVSVLWNLCRHCSDSCLR